jgi:hypothetical protein
MKRIRKPRRVAGMTLYQFMVERTGGPGTVRHERRKAPEHIQEQYVAAAKAKRARRREKAS